MKKHLRVLGCPGSRCTRPRTSLSYVFRSVTYLHGEDEALDQALPDAVLRYAVGRFQPLW